MPEFKVVLMNLAIRTLCIMLIIKFEIKMVSLKNEPYKHWIEIGRESPIVFINIGAEILYNLDSLLRGMVFIPKHPLWILIGIWIPLLPSRPTGTGPSTLLRLFSGVMNLNPSPV